MTILIDVALKSTVVLAAAWLATLGLRSRSAAARHTVWSLAFAALAILPLLSGLLPALDVPVPHSVAAIGGPVFRVTAQAGDAGSAGGGIAAPGAPGGSPGPLAPSMAWIGWLPALWAAGAAVMLVHLATAYVMVARLRRRGNEIGDAAWHAALRSAAAELGIRREIRLIESPSAGVPMAAGVFRPAILFPPFALAWDDEKRRMVLLHELAHVLRRDALTHLAARIALSLYWFHPLAWLAAREFLRERERACDDLVLAAGARPSCYAGHLLEVASAIQAPAVAAWAGVSMARRSQIEGRLVAILDARVNRGTASPAFAAGATLAAILLVVPLAAMRPQAEAPPPTTPAQLEALIRTAAASRDHATLDRTAAELLARRNFSEAGQVAAAALEVRGIKYGTKSAEYAQGLVQVGKVHRATGNSRLAKEAYEAAAALQLGGDAATLEYLGMNALARRDYERATELYQQALGRSPEAQFRGQLLTGLALARQHSGDDAGAEQNFRAALAILAADSGEYAAASELLSRFLVQKGRADEAASLQARAREIRSALVRAAGPSLTGAGPARKVGNGVEPPALSFKLEPQYSELARTVKYEGSVALSIVVGTDGQAYNFELRKSLGLGLDEQAADAVRQWRFKPGMKDGAPVPVSATIEVNFRLL